MSDRRSISSPALLAGAAVAALGLGSAWSVQAAEAAAGDQGASTVEDVVVTARRREEKAQDVPIALNVVGAEALAKAGTYTLGQVQQLVPTMQVFSQNARNTNVNIRGLGSNVALTNDGLEAGVGVYVDNVYYGRVGQSQFDLVDLDRIEVLRGPQGTLFGKNTTAGAINITSKLPSFTRDISGEVSVGDYGYHQVRASVSGPFADDKAAFRLSIADTHRDGYVKNIRTGKRAQDYDNSTIRGQILLKPSEDVSLRLIGDYSRQDQNCCIQLLNGVFTTYANGATLANNVLQRLARQNYTAPSYDAFARITDADSPYQANMKGYGLSSQLDWDFGGAALTAVSAYRWWDWYPANDTDNVGLPINLKGQTINHQRQFSQEIRLASTGDRKVDYVVGVYYFWQIVKGYGESLYGSAAGDWFRAPTSPLPLSTWNTALNGFNSRNVSTPETRSYAAFGQATWHITDALSLTGGLRYTYERKHGTYVQNQVGGLNITGVTGAQGIRDSLNPTLAYSASRKDGNLSGVVNLAYKVTPDILVYANYSRGSKSGGLNLTSFPIGVIVPTTVEPETVNAYEAGFKSQLFNRTLTLNGAAFWTDVDNYQSAVATLTNLGTTLQYLQNVGPVRSRGFEGDAAWKPSRNFTLTAAVAYTDTYYRDYTNAPQAVERANQGGSQNLTGQQVAGVPKFTYSLGADVSAPLALGATETEVYAHADYAHRSGFFTQVTNSAYARVKPYGLANARIGIRTASGAWDISVWARNLFDEEYFQTLNPLNTGLIVGIPGDPRTVGATLRTAF